MVEHEEDFAVHPFVQELFEDLSLTLPSLGCRFQGTVTPNDLTAVGQRSFLKNKLFLLFADFATHTNELTIKFVPKEAKGDLEFCFYSPCNRLDSNACSAWDGALFSRYTSSEGQGFSLRLPLGSPLPVGPVLDWRELYRLYGSPEAGKRMVALFLQRAESLIPQLKNHIEARNCSEVLRISHTLKGSSRGVFAVPFSGKALKLEMLSRSQTLEGADELYSNLLYAFQELVHCAHEGDL